jgi:hypothetical protein
MDGGEYEAHGLTALRPVSFYPFISMPFKFNQAEGSHFWVCPHPRYDDTRPVRF